MSGDSPPWRAILWVERFLPAPKPIASDAERAKQARRVGAWVPLVAILPAIMPIMIRQRHELGAIVAQNGVTLEQLALIVTGCAIVATIAAAGVFGARAWRDARGAR